MQGPQDAVVAQAQVAEELEPSGGPQYDEHGAPLQVHANPVVSPLVSPIKQYSLSSSTQHSNGSAGSSASSSASFSGGGGGGSGGGPAAARDAPLRLPRTPPRPGPRLMQAALARSVSSAVTRSRGACGEGTAPPGAKGGLRSASGPACMGSAGAEGGACAAAEPWAGWEQQQGGGASGQGCAPGFREGGLEQEQGGGARVGDCRALAGLCGPDGAGGGEELQPPLEVLQVRACVCVVCV